MVKVKVLLPFEDKVTHKNYVKNDIVEMSAKRFNEIRRKGNYIELAEENTSAKAKS